MDWIAARPVISGNVVHNVKARLVVGERTGRRRINLTISETFAKNFSWLKKGAKIRVLTDPEDVAHFKVEVNKDGDIVVGEYAKGSYRIDVLPWDDGDDGPFSASRDAAPCKVESKDATGFVAFLPEKWFEDDPPPRAIPAPPSPAKTNESEKAATPAHRNGNPKIDAVAYLKSKGHKIAKLAAGRWQLDGEIRMVDFVVDLVNSHRAKVELPPINSALIV